MQSTACRADASHTWPVAQFETLVTWSRLSTASVTWTRERVDHAASISAMYGHNQRTYTDVPAFLVDGLGVTKVAARYDGAATYHDSCSGLRELGVKQQPRTLLRSVQGLTVREMQTPEVCCGFGGTFCVKYPEISNAMVGEKTADIAASGADTLLAGDLGCLMNMAGKLSRQGRNVAVRHVAEVLAGQLDQPAICERP